jgi:hypothetical protein
MNEWSVGAMEYWVSASLRHFTAPISTQEIS